MSVIPPPLLNEDHGDPERRRSSTHHFHPCARPRNQSNPTNPTAPYNASSQVRCSGRIDGASCAYCTRKKHVCVFSVKQKPGPKCLRHHCEEGSSAEESPAVFPAVAAISSAAAALSLCPPGTSAAAAAAGAPTPEAGTRPPSARSGGGRSAGEGDDGGRRACYSSSPSSLPLPASKRKNLGPAGAGHLEEVGGFRRIGGLHTAYSMPYAVIAFSHVMFRFC